MSGLALVADIYSSAPQMGTADFEDQYQQWRNTILLQGWVYTNAVIGGLVDGAPTGQGPTLAATRLAAVGGPQALVNILEAVWD